MARDSLVVREFQESTRGFLEALEGELERAEMHRNKPIGTQILECSKRFIRSHVHMPEALRVISSNRKHGDLGPKLFSYFREALEIGGIPRVINPPTSVLEYKASEPSMNIAKGSRTPMLRGHECDLPISTPETLPPFEFYNSVESQPACQGAATPGHNGDLGCG